MRAPADAFGQQLWDIHHHGYPCQVIERDDAFLGIGPGAVYLAGYDAWRAAEREAVGVARGRVLDVGCGAGRHALHLQERGLEVLAIDVSPLAVRLCRERGVRRAEVMDVADVGRLGERFDTVLMLGNNLGLLGTPRRGRWLLRAFARLTGPDGLLIGGNLDPYRTDEPLHLAYHQRNRERGRMPGQIRMRVRHKNLVGPWFDYLFLSPDELAALVEGTGWRVSRLIGAEGPEYVAVLEKAPGG